MGADIAMSDLFLASLIPSNPVGASEKPTTLTKKELEEWAELFRRKPAARSDDEPD
jgi:hypothetical protein